MKVAGLFAGIGGFELGFDQEGFSPMLLCENSPAATAVLREKFPAVPLVSDIRALKSLPRGTEVICAGFPCQNLSSSGEKVGIEGDQSTLIDEVFRLLRRRKVQWVIIENVKFMLHLQRGSAMRRIVNALEELGYRWAYRVMNSHAFGVPQRRERVFIVAALDGNPWDVLFSDHSLQPSEVSPTVNNPVGFYWTEGTYATGLAANAVPPLKGGSTIGIPSPPAILFPSGVAATPDIRDAERLQGFPIDWTSCAAKTEKASSRWKLVGNAVTVNVSRWLARQIKKPQHFEREHTMPLNGKWPLAAWGDCKEGRFQVAIGSGPNKPEIVGLDSYLRFDPKPLSKRAADGFIGRARAGNLRYPGGFLESLERYADNSTGQAS